VGRSIALFVLGIAIAGICSIAGVGGGIFAVPALHYFFGSTLRQAIAGSLVLVLATSTAATISEIFHPGGQLFPVLIAVLTVASLAGAQVGYRLGQRASTRAIKAVFCVVALFVGARLVASLGIDHIARPAAQTMFVPAMREHVAALLIGFVAGILVPLLGVGGGVIVVPAMLLFVPEVGYLGARAASLAMATVTSARSVWMYARVRQIDWQKALPLAGGAAFGGFFGDQLVHLPGATVAGEALLGATLLVAGVRFAFDVRASRPS
jgi:uncharacterized membrane protein YfcA